MEKKRVKFTTWQKYCKEHDYGSGKDLIQAIIPNLPHGSGINYSWYGWLYQNGKIALCNNYDAMNEITGMYCHMVQFAAIYHIEGDYLILEHVELINGSREYPCCAYDIRSYLEETIGYNVHIAGV